MSVLCVQLNPYSQQVRGCGSCLLLHSLLIIQWSGDVCPACPYSHDWMCALCGLDTDGIDRQFIVDAASTMMIISGSAVYKFCMFVCVCVHVCVCASICTDISRCVVCATIEHRGLQWTKHWINAVCCSGNWWACSHQQQSCLPLFLLSFVCCLCVL